MWKIFKKSEKNSNSELQSLIGDYELPSFSAAVMKVLTVLRDPDFSMTEVAEHLEGDPGLHVRVLKTVNSAAFGLSKRVGNLHHAVTLLGRSRLETIVLSQAVNSILPSVEMPFFNMTQFWLTAARRASIARALAHHLHPVTQIEAFTAGLLQDMALPILVSTRPEEYKVILERWNSDINSSLTALERETFGYDHSTVGALLAEKWDLPKYLITAISCKQTKDRGVKVEPAIELVSRIRWDDEERATEAIVKSCVEEYGMEKEMVLEMAGRAFEDAEELSKMLR